MQRIVGIGNSLVDVLAQVGGDQTLAELGLPKGSMQLIGADDLPRISGAMHQMATKQAVGGSMSNTIKALSRLGAPSAFVGKIGSDELGRFYRDELDNMGVDSRLIVNEGGHSGVAYTFITPDGQRTFATYLGSAAEMTADNLDDTSFAGCDMLYVEGYLVQNHALMDRAFDLAKQLGMTTGIDLASYNVVEADKEYFTHLLRDCVDIVFANEEEALAFTGKQPLEAARELGNLCRIAVVKMGKDGSCVYMDGVLTQTGAEPVDHVVDTTGAGDFFAAGFLYGLTKGCDAAECLRLGGVLAEHVIQHVGTTLPGEVWDAIKAKI